MAAGPPGGQSGRWGAQFKRPQARNTKLFLPVRGGSFIPHERWRARVDPQRRPFELGGCHEPACLHRRGQTELRGSEVHDGGVVDFRAFLRAGFCGKKV